MTPSQVLPQEGTPAIRLLKTVWDNANEGRGHSWTRLNSVLHSTLCLAMDSGFKFAIEDFDTAYKSFRGGYWFGENNGERFYTKACQTSNKSAAIAFEAFAKRKPFIYEECLCDAPHGGGSSGGRIYVGRRFAWQGEHVTCTSIADDGLSLTACGYDGTDRTPKRRYRITNEDFQKVRKALAAFIADVLLIEEVYPGEKALHALADAHGLTPYVAAKFYRQWVQTKAGKAWREACEEKKKETSNVH